MSAHFLELMYRTSTFLWRQDSWYCGREFWEYTLGSYYKLQLGVRMCIIIQHLTSEILSQNIQNALSQINLLENQ